MEQESEGHERTRSMDELLRNGPDGEPYARLRTYSVPSAWAGI